MIKKFAISLLWLYQRTLSPDHSWVSLYFPYGACRYSPTCSQYAIDAIQKYGVFRGGGYAVWRVCRCHPFAKSRIDPV